MTPPQKTSHWNSLAETLGAQVPPEQPASDVEPTPAPISTNTAAQVAPPPRRQSAPDKPKPAPRKSNWGEVASVLGLAPPPEPKPAPEPVASAPREVNPESRSAERAERIDRPAKREPVRETARLPERRDERPRAESPPDEPRFDEPPRPAEPRVREWNAPPDDASDIMEDLGLRDDDSDIDETEVDIIDLEDAEGDAGEPRGEAAPRPAGEQDDTERRPRRRRRRGRRRRRPEGEDAGAPGAGPRESRPSDRRDADNNTDAESASAPSEAGQARTDADREGRPRRRKRRRGRSGRERPPPHRPAPDESAREEEAAFISESGGGDELDADFGPEGDEPDLSSAAEFDDERSARRAASRPEEVDVESEGPDDEDAPDDEGEQAIGKKHKIPTWQETIGLIVDANLAGRGKSSGSSQRGGRGRGRGRGR